MTDAFSGTLRDGEVLGAGMLSARYRDGELLDVSVGADCVLDRVYVALRDRNWATMALERRLVDAETGPDGFAFRLVAQPVEWASFPFRFELTCHARRGKLVLSMTGRAHGNLLSNRIGFCLLHPLELAGTAVHVDGRPGGAKEFPVRVSPDILFGQACGLQYRSRTGHRVDLRFEGDLFETEDQRNWIDGSYKTYCTPLHLGYPRAVSEGDRIEQTVTLAVADAALTAPGTAPSAAAGVPTRPARHRASVTVRAGTWVPPGVGVGIAAGNTAPVQEVVARLHPAQLVAELDLRRRWQELWHRAITQSTEYNVPLDVGLVACSPADVLAWGRAAAEAGTGRIARVAVYDARTHVSTAGLLSALRGVVRAAELNVAVGGGSRAHFAELNRMELPDDRLDFVTYSATPQVHATDERSVMQTPRALAATVTQARELAGGRPVHVSPITFAPRFNAVATVDDTDDDTDADRLADPRQAAPVAAAWTVAALDALAGSRCANLFALTGPHGVLGTDGATPFPVFHVLAWLADHPGHLSDVDASGAVAALAARDGTGHALLLANLEPAGVEVDVHTPHTAVTVRLAGYEVRPMGVGHAAV